MPVLINFKICDNSPDCSGIEVCPTGALFWDEKNKTIAIDNGKCVSCGKCEETCPVDAIRVAKNEREYKKIKKEIDEDSSKISDLFIDKYGAQPIHPAFLISEDKFDVQILRSTKLTALELFNNDSIMCLRCSIPIKKLFENVDIKYGKMKIKDGSLLKKYKIKKLPSLLFFRDGKLIGNIQGYYDTEKEGYIIKRVNKIIS